MRTGSSPNSTNLAASDSSRSTTSLFAAAGDDAAAFARLEPALREREHELGFLAVDPAMAPLRGDPRFASLAARIGV